MSKFVFFSFPDLHWRSFVLVSMHEPVKFKCTLQVKKCNRDKRTNIFTPRGESYLITSHLSFKYISRPVRRICTLTFSTWRFLWLVSFRLFQFIHLAPVPGKPISANRGLNLANRGWKFILRLDSVPESTINTNQVINEGLNLIHLARSINSLIGAKTWSKQTKWRT